MDRCSSPLRRRNLRHWCSALLLLGVLAFSVLQLAASTHQHAASEIDSCQLCVGVSHGGAAAPPAVPALLPLAAQSAALPFPSITPPVYLAAPSHAWRSRGPPVS
jgi:hypothetical protein